MLPQARTHGYQSVPEAQGEIVDSPLKGCMSLNAGPENAETL